MTRYFYLPTPANDPSGRPAGMLAKGYSGQISNAQAPAAPWIETDASTYATKQSDRATWNAARPKTPEQIADEAAQADLVTERDVIINEAPQMVTDIATFLAIGSPSNAQVLAEVRAIDQRQRKILRYLFRQANFSKPTARPAQAQGQAHSAKVP